MQMAFIFPLGKMPISPSHFNAVSVTNNTKVVIEILSEKPTSATVFNPPKQAGQLCGYYNAIDNYVELFIVDASGLRALKVG